MAERCPGSRSGPHSARPPGTSSDTGEPDVRLSAALARWVQQPAPAARAEVLAALAGARVFLALAARALDTEVDEGTGLVRERATDLALLSVVAPDGSRALPAFSDGSAVQMWRAEARPLPLPGPVACTAARDDGAVALLVDPPTAAFVVSAGELAALAHGHVPVPGTPLSTRRTTSVLTDPARTPDAGLVAALGDALAGEPVSAARVLDGPDGPVLGVVPAGPATPADLAGLAGRVSRRLGPLLPPGGLDLAAVAPSGPGHPVPLGTRRSRRPLRRRGR